MLIDRAKCDFRELFGVRYSNPDTQTQYFRGMFIVVTYYFLQACVVSSGGISRFSSLVVDIDGIESIQNSLRYFFNNFTFHPKPCGLLN